MTLLTDSSECNAIKISLLHIRKRSYTNEQIIWDR